MEFVQNFPFFCIMLYLAGGVTCCVMKPKVSRTICLALNALVTALMVSVLVYTVRTGESYVFYMGHFPAPWGNEIRIGCLEALTAAVFSGVMTATLMGGMEHIFEDIEQDKLSLYFTVCNLLMSSLFALVFTNDIFTAYVFVEINTIASCALVMLNYRSGRALVATTRYLMMSLLGSGLFLMGIIILYAVTGQLLMEPAGEEIQALVAGGEYDLPLTIVTGLFAIGLALKSALYPFHSWLPDAHGSATAASSGILSGLVLKGYIFLLIKIYVRVFGEAYVLQSGVTDVLLIFGVLAMVLGSVFALRERDLKRLLAYSSVAQIGYIYAGIGLGTHAGMEAACIQIVVHAFTKPMLFCTAGGFMSVSGGSKKFSEIRGAARRDPLSGAAFVVGALSMIGIPLFAGFTTKLRLTDAALTAATWKCVLVVIAVIASAVLNALYYVPAIAVLYGKRDDGKYEGIKAKKNPMYIVAIVFFIAMNFYLGTQSEGFMTIVQNGLRVLG